MSYESVPGFVSESEAFDETTIVVQLERLVDAALHLRDELGFNFLADVAAADYLAWNERTVAGYWGSDAGRDINRPGSWGLARKPEPKAKRFSVSYHLVKLASGAAEAPRLRLQIWCEDGDAVPSLIPVWPTADWHEREAWDMMGIRIEGHPLRKDYPLGGEPVRFSSEE